MFFILLLKLIKTFTLLLIDMHEFDFTNPDYAIFDSLEKAKARIIALEKFIEEDDRPFEFKIKAIQDYSDLES